MKKILTLTAMCCTALTTITTTPAMAAVAVPTAEMQAVCAATTIVNPNPNSTYAATLNDSSITRSTGTEYVSATNTISDIPGGQFVSATGPTFVAGTEGRNGQSPNIFGTFKSVETYTGRTLIQDVTYSQDTTFTFGCTVSKTNKNNGNVETPPGLQVTGQTITKTEVTRTAHTNIQEPNVDVVQLSGAVICNSPTKNPGVWRAQNGYTGGCSRALFDSISSVTIHSKSLPPIGSTEQAAIATATINNDSGPATVADFWTEESL
jgi:hypothetical protein